MSFGVLLAAGFSDTRLKFCHVLSNTWKSSKFNRQSDSSQSMLTIVGAVAHVCHWLTEFLLCRTVIGEFLRASPWRLCGTSWRPFLCSFSELLFRLARSSSASLCKP